MTSQTELLTLKFYFIFLFFELLTRCEKISNLVLELLTRYF